MSSVTCTDVGRRPGVVRKKTEVSLRLQTASLISWLTHFGSLCAAHAAELSISGSNPRNAFFFEKWLWPLSKSKKSTEVSLPRLERTEKQMR